MISSMIDSNKAGKPRAILLLCHFYPGTAGAIIDHIDAFQRFSENEYFILSNLGDLPVWLDLSHFDAIVFHYSLVACYDNYISPVGRKRIRDYQGFKAAFVQDDYRWINDTVNAFAYMRINALFPLTNSDIMDAVYDPAKLPGVRRETVLAGYVPKNLVELKVKPFCDRTMDVVYRARKLPAWMGSHTLQKWQIADRFNKDAPRYGLKVDISFREKDRIYGEKWIDFVANSRAMIGTESGSSLCDFTGLIQRNVEAHEKEHPDTDFETLRDLYFKDEDCKIMMNVISPRCFEAAALRTLMILYEGEYSGVLKPWRHYVPLKWNHSNMDEVARILASPEDAQKIIDRAYSEIAENSEYSYEAMIHLVDRVMNEEWSVSFEKSTDRMSKEEFDWLATHKPTSFENINSINERKILWYPASAMSSVKFVGLEASEKFGLDIGVPLSLDTVTIRWKTSFGHKIKQFELRGLRGSKVKFVRKIVNTTSANFIVVNLLLENKVVNRLEFLSCDESTLRMSHLVYISVVGSEVFPGRIFLNLKKFIRGTLAGFWHALPERVRTSMRPIVGKIRIRLQILFRWYLE